MRLIVSIAAAALLSACAGGIGPPLAPGAALNAPRDVRTAAPKVYQPPAVGNSWTYQCNHLFTIVDRVTGTYKVAGLTAYALSLQIPSSPTKSVFVVQLLANDAKGNTWIHGYLIHGKVHPVKATEIVAAKPVPYKYYDYPGPGKGTISRQFLNFEYTNKTKLGVFWVAPYFESGRTHNYGYSLGRGVMEEDHGPQYKYDCLITKYVLR